MKHVLGFFSFAGFIAVMAVCLSAFTYAPSDEEVALDAAWDYVCNVDKVFDCRGLEKPELIFHDGINGTLGSYGVFWPGENMIFVRANMPGDDMQKRMNTTVHELTHYLQDQMGYQRVGSCDWEAGAFAVADRYAIYIGRPDLVRGADWWKPYRQCQNYGG